MKFTLLTAEGRKELAAKKKRTWHKRFAFWPRRLSSDVTQVVWLEYYWRKWDDRYNHKGYHEARWIYVESCFDVLRDGS